MRGKIINYFSFILIGLFVALMIQLKKNEIMKPGARMPQLTFEGKMGKEYLINDYKTPTVIIWFHPDCAHCLYQLTEINDHLHLLGETKFFFLTADRNFPANKHVGLWPNLTSTNQVRFGILDKERFTTSFGKVVTPTTYIFNKQGNLEKKLLGEVKIGKIHRIIQNLNAREYENSGFN